MNNILIMIILCCFVSQIWCGGFKKIWRINLELTGLSILNSVKVLALVCQRKIGEVFGNYKVPLTIDRLKLYVVIAKDQVDSEVYNAMSFDQWCGGDEEIKKKFTFPELFRDYVEDSKIVIELYLVYYFVKRKEDFQGCLARLSSGALENNGKEKIN